MRADDHLTPGDGVVLVLLAPVWLPVLLTRTCWRKLAEMRERRKREAGRAEQAWAPQTDMERAVYAALLVAGKPVTNDELARLMRVSKGEASKRVKLLESRLSKERIGREVRIALPPPALN